MEDFNKRILITDGWHPTINPSSRMPIHHHRFVQLLGEHDGILNELPRQYGGNTLRAMHIDKDGNIIIFDLNKTMKYVPWWIPSTSDRAIDLITGIILEATKNEMCLSAFAYNILLETYLNFAAGNSRLTFGEILCQANNYLYKEIYSSLPEINLMSLTRLSLARLLSDGLHNLSGDIFEILNSICLTTNKSEFGFLGVLTNYKGFEWRLTYTANSNELSIVTLYRPHSAMKIELDIIIKSLYQGVFLPSSQLLIAIEFSLTTLGYEVVHYGNAYKRHEIFANACGLTNQVLYWDDNNDSWNFVMIKGTNDVVYPLHLLDLMCLGDKASGMITKLISRSLEIGKPIIISTRRGGDLLEALSD